MESYEIYRMNINQPLQKILRHQKNAIYFKAKLGLFYWKKRSNKVYRLSQL